MKIPINKKKDIIIKALLLILYIDMRNLFGINTKNALKSKITKMTPELIAEIKKMDEYSNQAKFLAKYNINTEQELLEFEKSAYERVNPLKSKRENLWKKHKRAKTDEEKHSYPSGTLTTPIILSRHPRACAWAKFFGTWFIK